MLLANELSSSQAGTIVTANVAVLTVSLVLFAIIALVIMVPAALRALATQQAIFDTLIDVPVEMINALKDRFAKKIEEVRKAEEAAAFGLDVDEEGADAPPVFEDLGPQDARGGDVGSVVRRGIVAGPQDGLQAIINAYAQKRAVNEAVGHAASHAERTGCCGSGGIARESSRRGHRHFRRATNSRNSLLFSMLWPIVVYCSYFIGMYFWRLELVTFSSYAKVRSGCCVHVACCLPPLRPHLVLITRWVHPRCVTTVAV
jgi:hypothetical protein